MQNQELISKGAVSVFRHYPIAHVITSHDKHHNAPSPAMSVMERRAGSDCLEPNACFNQRRRGSGTSTTAWLGSIVQKGWVQTSRRGRGRRGRRGRRRWDGMRALRAEWVPKM